ncbi:MAG TPA: oxygen-independent coproporphyrinogen III oxidase, partial [Moraxellaceae bacterium]|nr:oxygen-independent coproporphyrinogen III oxidase [Moraxellaceae bacterium]
MTDQTRPLSDSELPTFDRPVEIIENPYANANRSYTTQTHLFNEAIINKYNRSGPRYTSYPTALEFTPITDGMEARVLAEKDPRVPVSLYFH